MEYKKGSYLQVGEGTFSGRFQAIRVVDDATFTSISDSTKRTAIEYYISDSRLAVKAGAIIAVRDGLYFSRVTITGGTIEIIF